MNVRILTVVAVLVATPAAAQLGVAEMQKASGLAEVLKKSKPCGFSVDAKPVSGLSGILCGGP